MMTNTPQHIGHLVEKYLRSREDDASSVRVVFEDVRLADSKDEWWWVPVTFDSDPHKRYVYYELFSDIEEQLEESEHLNVLLIPRPTTESQAA